MRNQTQTQTQTTGSPLPKNSRRHRTPDTPPAPIVPQSHSTVRDRAMLVNLTVHQWLAKATDEAITAEVGQAHGIADGSGSYLKVLMPKSAMEKMKAAAGKLRSTHNKYTLPWDEWGTRILKASRFLDYNAEITKLIAEYETEFRDAFEAYGASGKTVYEERQQEAKLSLGTAWRAEDYPSLSVLKRKFGAKIRVMKVPDGEDFRIDMGAEVTAQVAADVTAQLRAEIESNRDERLEQAMTGLWELLSSLVSKLAEAVKGTKTSAIRSTLIKSINTLLDRLPDLNVTEDPNLEAMATEIRAAFSSLDAKGLRDSEAARADVGQKAEDILSRMQSFLS